MNYEILSIETAKKIGIYDKILNYVTIRIYEIQREMYDKKEINNDLLDELQKIQKIIKGK